MKSPVKKWTLLGVGAVVLAAAVGGTMWAWQGQNQKTNRVAVTMEKTYQNPMTLADEWEDYGIGDPYVLRYNGKYYLYCSTKDWRIGIKAWSSDDLVNWTYEGLVTEEPVTEGAYAPEVVYWNGSFYMYTSPGGKGHYVLRSDKPTGPFTVATDNLGLTIDGSVFIDDDGKWTFTHAEFGGIMASSMTDPYTIDAGQKLSASLGHWTEGSMIIKRNGRYFLTYTGNHVFSKGYRVNYAVAHDSPTGLYTAPQNNPIIISTEDDFNGLGHSATVMGPDMDSYYIVYHNLIGHSAEGPPVRMLNMDRLTFNGDKMAVLGPTHGAPTEAPHLPVFRDPLGATPAAGDSWEQATPGGQATMWMARPSTGDRFTAEFNAIIAPSGAASAASGSFESIVSYSDVKQYRAVRVLTDEKKLALIEVNGEEERVVQSAALPEGMDLSKLHTIRVESASEGTNVYWDGLLLAEAKEWPAAAGRIGYRWTEELKPELHYTAFSNEAGGSSDKKAIKPVPGTMEAVHGLTEAADGNAISSEGTPDGSAAALLNKKGTELAFPVNVKKDGTYLIAAMVSKASAGAKLEVSAGDSSLSATIEEAAFASEADWTKAPLGQLKLTQGLQWLTLKLVKGSAAIGYVEAAETTPVTEEQPVGFDETAIFGNWQETDGQYSVQDDSRDAKWFGGDHRWSDYGVSFDLTQTEEATGEASVLIRTTNESDFPDQVTDSFMGYEVAFRNGRVILRRISYEVNEELDSALLELTNGKPASIRVQAAGASIRIYEGDHAEPLLSYTDPSAFLHGRVGLRTGSPGWLFANVKIGPLKQ